MRSKELEKRLEKLEKTVKVNDKPNMILIRGEWFPLDNRPETIEAAKTTPIPWYGRWWRENNPPIKEEP
ncbi:MAG: hypothetical protein ABSB28_08620 [Candidatus Bathyarchaeia archaeon]